MDPVITRCGEQALGGGFIENPNGEPIKGRSFQIGENHPRKNASEDANQDRSRVRDEGAQRPEDVSYGAPRAKVIIAPVAERQSSAAAACWA
jgi:hypothetical protein